MKLRPLLQLIGIVAIATLLQHPSPALAAKKGKPSYKISFTVNGGHDSVMYLCCYYLKNIYAVDTAYPNKKGTFEFSKPNRDLPPGLYFFTNDPKGGGQYVDFVIYNEKPFFNFVANSDDWTNSMQTSGSEENRIFFDYQKRTNALFAEIDSMRATMPREEFKEYYKLRDREAVQLKMDILREHPQSMIAKIMRATRPITVPTTDSSGRKLTNNERYDYYMTHYFDSIPLDDDMIVRTPAAIFYNRVQEYFDTNLRGMPPSTIIRYADMLIERARPSKEAFHFLVHTIAEKYLQSSIAIYDEVYVHMILTYYATGQAFWAAPSTISDNVKRATTWEKLLVGKVAPELILRDTAQAFHSLHSQPNEYTLLIFWSPTCGHCKTVIPALYAKYEQYREQYHLGAFAILSEPDDTTREKWKTFINEHHIDWLNLDGGEANVDWREVYDITTTPQIYLLDRNKKIVGKKLNADTFEQLLKALNGASLK